MDKQARLEAERDEAYRLFYALNPELLPYHFPEDYPLPGPEREKSGELNSGPAGDRGTT